MKSEVMESEVMPRVGDVGRRGVRRFRARPPVAHIEYEMDLRGVRVEEVLP